jgi:hypothetical protein
MKIALSLCAALVILGISCKKSNDQINNPPPVTDTVKPPVIKVDTSTLLKSMKGYFYDVTGTTITDSNLVEWTYDNQRRIIQYSLNVGTYTDTLFYTYSNNGYSTDDHSYTSGSPSAVVHTVYYQHLQNRTDSAMVDGNRTYFYYNQLGQDSLEKVITGTGAHPTVITVNYYYTGQNLDSAITLYNAMLSSVSYYTNGNMTRNDLYTLDAANALEYTNQITYTNIPVGGLHVYFSASYLTSAVTVFDVSKGTTGVQKDSYKLDSVNRVVQWIINENQPYVQKYVLTYY